MVNYPKVRIESRRRDDGEWVAKCFVDDVALPTVYGSTRSLAVNLCAVHSLPAVRARFLNAGMDWFESNCAYAMDSARQDALARSSEHPAITHVRNGGLAQEPNGVSYSGPNDAVILEAWTPTQLDELTLWVRK